MTRLRSFALLLVPCLAALSACEVGPDYMRPAVPVPMAYKEDQGWMPASPQQAAAYQNWWSIYNDRVLDGLERQVDVSNQNLRAAEAAYRAARAQVGVDRGALVPAVTAGASARQSGAGSRSAGTGSGGATIYQAALGASWDIDVWGRIRRTVEASVATAQASAADIAAARLSVQSELAIDYFTLRAADEQAQLLGAAVRDFQTALTITQNRYQVGIATLADVYAAQTQIDSAEAQLVNTRLTRDRMEHAIAALIGKSASEVAVETASLTTTVPVVPAGVPSTLLERRPDVATSEYDVASANAQVGVAISAWFPDLTLTGSYGFAATSLGSLINASNAVWSFGPSLAETVFNGGAREAQTEQARARYDQAVANYRQTALTAFQQVEDQLATLKILEQQAAVEDRTVMDARQSEMLALNQYQAGTADFTTVINAQTTRLNAEFAALNVLNQRLAGSVDLIVALGGGWDASQVPKPGPLYNLPTDASLTPAPKS
jgi:NodT family efflux transporter outer membrane factor (OMF) lipoprotein